MTFDYIIGLVPRGASRPTPSRLAVWSLSRLSIHVQPDGTVTEDGEPRGAPSGRVHRGGRRGGRANAPTRPRGAVLRQVRGCAPYEPAFFVR